MSELFFTLRGSSWNHLTPQHNRIRHCAIVVFMDSECAQLLTCLRRAYATLIRPRRLVPEVGRAAPDDRKLTSGAARSTHDIPFYYCTSKSIRRLPLELILMEISVNPFTSIVQVIGFSAGIHEPRCVILDNQLNHFAFPAFFFCAKPGHSLFSLSSISNSFFLKSERSRCFVFSLRFTYRATYHGVTRTASSLVHFSAPGKQWHIGGLLMVSSISSR